MADQTGMQKERVQSLCRGMTELIAQNYRQGPVAAGRVFEALNALAFVAAATIAGTGEAHPQSLEWFGEALAGNLADALEYRGDFERMAQAPN
jgi:hypothetical protein